MLRLLELLDEPGDNRVEKPVDNPVVELVGELDAELEAAEGVELCNPGATEVVCVDLVSPYTANRAKFSF